MSLFQPQPQSVEPARYPAESNSLALAGFICSLVGLVLTGGILCPIGLVLSLVALGRRPRGFAIAGVIIGLVGSCGLIIGLIALFAGAAALAVLGIAAVALTDTEKLEITSDMINIVIAVKAYEEENRYLPADLDGLGLKTTNLADPWGAPYRYHLQEDDPGFDIESAGEDGQFGTIDDVRLSALGDAWQAGGFGFHVSEHEDGGRVRITVGERTITAGGDADGSSITLDMGNRVIEIIGDESGGQVIVGSGDDATTQPDGIEDETPPDDEAPADDG